MLKRASLLAAASSALLLLTSCGGGTGDEQDGTLHILTTDTVVGLDPATSLDFPTTTLGLVGRRLTTWSVSADNEVEVVPDLATDTGTPSDDGLSWTYTLKDDIFFENGDPITSADIKWAVERTFAPELAGGLTYHVGLLVGGDTYTGPFDGAELDSIETPDDRTIVFRLNAPFGDWPWITAMNAFIPVPRGEGTDPAEYDNKPVASGPYRVETNTDGTETVLVRNEYWDSSSDDVRTAEPDRIEIEQSQSPATIAQSLIADAGEAQNSFNANPLGAAELALAGSDPSVTDRLVTADGGVQYYVALNIDSHEFSDPRVRQAVEYATDRDAVIRAVGGEDAASPATTLIPPGVPGHEQFDLFPYDPDRARTLLQEAGYGDGLTLDLWVANEDTGTAQALQESLRQAGITVTINPLEAGTLYGEAMGGNADYDMLLSFWIGDYPSPASNISLLFDSSYIDGGFNLSRYANPDIDAAMASAEATTSIDQSVSEWSDIDRQIMEDAAVVPLYVNRNSFLRGSSVGDFYAAAYPPFQNYLTISLGQ